MNQHRLERLQEIEHRLLAIEDELTQIRDEARDDDDDESEALTDVLHELRSAKLALLDAQEEIVAA